MRAWNLFSRKKKNTAEVWNFRTMFGPNLNFADKEAYKLLRTNIMFSFPNEGRGHVIGVSSSVQDEGKSSTACNAAYALAESGVRVILIEGDLRRPSLNTKLGIAKVPGITNLLVSGDDYRQAIQTCALAPNLDILTSGDIPPNPSELLTSSRMELLIEQMKKVYDYIVMDLPPITLVSDTLAVSKLLDGVLLVVRAGVSDQQILAEAIRQLETVGVRILGFVFRDTDASGKNYSKSYNKKYDKYYNAYMKR